jgi:hypothetical protein
MLYAVWGDAECLGPVPVATVEIESCEANARTAYGSEVTDEMRRRATPTLSAPSQP